mgnify:FL=1
MVSLKKLLSVIFVPSFLLMSACSLSEVQVEKISDESSIIENRANVGSNESSATENREDTGSEAGIPERAAIGDKLFAENLVMNGGSGTIYWTINKAEAFKTAQDAGLQLDDMFSGEFADGINWNAAENTFTDNYVLVILHITIENVDAISRDYAEEPEKYDKYDFRVDALGVCSYGPLMYFSKMGECSAHPSAFHLEPGESTEMDAGYLVDLREIDLKEVTFNTAATPEYGTIIALNLS